jgi:zinc protease
MSPVLTGNLLRKSLIVVFLTLIFGFQLPVFAQTTPEPQREQLLNGLRILIWPGAGDQDVLLKLRIHSGAAFDLAGKAGGMALLGDMLFPDPATREYFTEEMQGRLNVITNYDSITITMQGRASEFERIVEILRTALVTSQLTAENVAKARDGRIKVIRGVSISPATIADRAIATRLFGNFPYGQPYTGSVESLERIDRVDLLLAHERFLNPNNATLVVIGTTQTTRVMRTLRQLIGVWRKSEQIIPTTFRQPESPDARTLIINAPTDQSAEVRLATRGLARSDRDVAAATMLATVARARWQRLVPVLAQSPVFVRHEAHVLPGMFVMGATINSSLAAKSLEAARNTLQSLVTAPPTAAELEQAKNEAIVEYRKELATPDGMAEAWLNLYTYNLPSIAEQLQALSGVSANDLQRTATRLFHDAAIASVVAGNSAQLRAELEPHIKVELLGEINQNAVPTPTRQESKPTSRPNAAIKPD